MIAAAFPPAGGSGVQRTAKFAKYLPRCGWRPVVWTVDAVDGLPQDPSLLADLPNEVVLHRAPHGGMARRLRRGLDAVLATDGAPRLARGLAWRLRRGVGSGRMPDEFAGWARTSVRPACRLIEQEPIDAIYSTFSPASNHLLAMELHQRTGRPWVADFRDLWTDDYRYTESSLRHRRAHRRLEQQILESADAVIGVSDRQSAILAQHVPAAVEKFITITNGFDPQDFSAARSASAAHDARQKRESRFTIAHVGRLDRWRIHDALFDGLRQFARCTDAAEIRIVGHAAEPIRARLKQTGLACAFIGETTHHDAIREMSAADALLLCVPDGPNGDSVIPAKVFEYLAAGRPIIMVGPPDGACADIVRQCAAGAVVPFQAAAIARVLEQSWNAKRTGSPWTGCGSEKLEPFSRVRLTERLADLFDRFCDRSIETCASDSPKEVCLS